jgi:DNA repair exonuclease SbcCD nuclease subunit
MASRRVAHIADIHFRSHHLEDIIESWNFVIDNVLSNNVEFLVVAGDLFETYNISDKAGTVADIVLKINEGLVRLTKAGIKVIIVEGNHDQAYGEHLGAIEILRHIDSDKNLFIITKEFTNLLFDDLNFICFPWYKNRQELIEDLKKCSGTCLANPVKKNVFIGHMLVQGSLNTHSIEVQDDVYLTAAELLTVPASVYCLGHIHMPQSFKSNIIYSGPICQLNFGEEKIEPRMMIYDIHDDKLDIQEVKIPGKKYKNIDINTVEELAEFVNNKDDHNYYKLKTHFDLNTVKENEAYVKVSSDRDIAIVAQKINIAEREDVIKFDDYSPKILLENWCKHNGIDSIPYEELEQCMKG